MIADRLEDRWKQAATVPSYEVEADEPLGEENVPAADDSLTTLDEMMGWRKRHRATVRA
jgi:hypothetical protein